MKHKYSFYIDSELFLWNEQSQWKEDHSQTLKVFQISFYERNLFHCFFKQETKSLHSLGESGLCRNEIWEEGQMKLRLGLQAQIFLVQTWKFMMQICTVYEYVKLVKILAFSCGQSWIRHYFEQNKYPC